MTEKKGYYVYKIDRDDYLDDWLHKHYLYMTNGLFFEYELKSNGFFNIVAGIDYCSRRTGYDNMIISRHQTICDLLNVPYFCVYLEGEVYYDYNYQRNLKRLNCYTINYEYCNSKAQRFLNKLKKYYNLRNFIFTEQEYSNILHLLRGMTTETILFSSDVYAEHLAYTKIVRERHACFGKGIYQSDMDLILYSVRKTSMPVMIVEFKSNHYMPNCFRDVPGQEQLLKELANRLSIPVLKIWHPDKDVSQFWIIKEYSGRIKFNKTLTEKELIAYFKHWSYTYNA